MPRPQVHDTSVLIPLINDPAFRPATFERAFATGRVWLSSVVVAELYAGSRSRDQSQVIAGLVDLMAQIDRLLVPTHEDWELAGQLINRQSRLAGAVIPRDHLADALITLSAARLKGTVVTLNVRHFRVWSTLAKSAGLDVTATPYRA